MALQEDFAAQRNYRVANHWPAIVHPGRVRPWQFGSRSYWCTFSPRAELSRHWIAHCSRHRDAVALKSEEVACCADQQRLAKSRCRSEFDVRVFGLDRLRRIGVECIF